MTARWTGAHGGERLGHGPEGQRPVDWWDDTGGPVLVWTVAALACYLVTVGVTARLNVPLNDRLEAAGPARLTAGRAGPAVSPPAPTRQAWAGRRGGTVPV
ncbi:anthrone oxygenase family protein [Micromonospora sp. DT46]|uniref:anthrone oxygenase family protein n=1 Tax=Micromonospora sp. DT46 TaxID=3393435 RepID=UPI003CF32627